MRERLLKTKASNCRAQSADCGPHGRTVFWPEFPALYNTVIYYHTIGRNTASAKGYFQLISMYSRYENTGYPLVYYRGGAERTLFYSWIVCFSQ